MRAVVKADWNDPALRACVSQTDDSAFCRYAAQQQIAHFLLDHLRRADRLDLFPPSWIQALQAEIDRRADRDVALRGVLTEMIEALTAAGIDYRVLKGLPFAMHYYGNTTARRAVDIDLLVQRDQLDQAIRVLWSHGFRCRPRRLKGPPEALRIDPRVQRTNHALAFTRESIHLDLHWLLRAVSAYRIDETAPWQNPVMVNLDDSHPVATPNEDSSLLLLLLSIAGDIARGGCRLKHLLDIYMWLRLTRDRIDWADFMARRTAENTHAISANVLAITADVFDCRAEFPALDQMLRDNAGLLDRESVQQAVALVHRPNKSIENALWFARVYPIRWRRDLLWLWRANSTHPARVPKALNRGIKFLARLIAYGARRTAGIER